MKKGIDRDIAVLCLFFSSGLVVLIVTIYACLTMKFAGDFLRSNIESRLMAACHAASYLVKADEIEQFVIPEDMEKPLYKELKNRLVAFAEEHNIIFIYYLRPTLSPGMVQFIIDNDITSNTVDLSTPPLEAERAPQMALGGMMASSGLGNYSVGYEGYLSAFAPVFDVEGRVVAVVGVDISDEQAVNLRERVYILATLLVVSILVAVGSGYAGFSAYKKKAVQAQAANISKSIFLANMSHELRTPMNAIVGMTKIAQKKSSDIEQKSYCLAKIEDASIHLLGVINDILDMSKIEANKFELAKAKFDFEKMLHRVVDIITPRVEEKRQNFFVFLDAAIPAFLNGDEQHLAQVIANLLSNAVKFTPEGGRIRLEAHLHGKEKNICTLQIAVKDTGIGISAEQQTRLFQPFVQANSTISSSFGGTGLGLVISRRIAEMMGGTIWIESELGQGSTFILRARLEAIPAEKQDFSAFMDSPLRMLMVDESSEIREYCRDMAARFGFNCNVAADEAEALELLGREACDVCFIDWKIPGVDNMQLPRKIKDLHSEISVVLVMPIAAWSRLEVEARTVGVSAHISKPLFPSVMAECIWSCLGLTQGQTPSTVPLDEPQSFAGRRVLLVEDVEINREIVLELLKPTSLAIECAEDGQKAVNLYSGHDDGYYDLILMDVQMPNMDGYEATRRIRDLEQKRSAGRRLPIVAMTANVFHEDIDKCLAVGMDAHLGKPIDLEEVSAILHRYL